MTNGSNRDFTIDMRMRADFASARNEVRKTGEELEDLGEKAKKASADVGGAGAAPRNRSQQTYLKASQQTQAAIAAEIGLIGKLQDRIAGSAANWEDLADTEAMLDKAMAKGLITAEEYDEALAGLDKQHTALQRSATQQGKALDGTLARYDRAGAQLRRLAQDEAKLKDAVDKGRISRDQYNRAMANIAQQRKAVEGTNAQARAMQGLSLQSVGVQRNLTQLLTYTATGNWQLAGNQVLQLGNQAGVASMALSGLGLVAGVTAGAVAGLAFASIKGYTELRALDTALISTGNSAGVTVGALAQMRDEIGEATGEYGKAQQAAVLLGGSGKAAADSLEDMVSAAVDLSELTGKTIEQTTQEILGVAKAPVQALVELNDRYHFLTTATIEQVQALADQGREQDAVRVGLDALAGVSRQRVEEMRAHAGSLERAWEAVNKKLASVWQMLKNIGRDDPEARIAAGNRGLAAMQRRIDDLRYLQSQSGAFGPDSADIDRQIAKIEAQMKASREDIAGWQSRKDAIDATAAAEAKQQKIQDEGIQARLRLTDGLKEGATNAEKLRVAVQGVYKDLIKLREANPDDPLLTDLVFGTDGKVTGGIADKRIKQLQEQFKDRKPKGSKTEAQQAEEAAKRELGNLARQAELLADVQQAQDKVTEASRIRYEVEEGAFKLASAATKEALLDYAQLVDGEQQRVDAAKQYVQVQLEIARLQGRPVPPELDQEAKQLQKLAQYYENLGQATEAAETRRLLSMRGAAQELEVLQTQYQGVIATLELASQRIQLGVQSGLKTEAEARREIVDLYKTQGATLDLLIPKMEALARTTGNEQALQSIQRMRFELEQMRQSSDLVKQSLASTFEGSFASALESLATNTKSLAEAGRQFILDMAAGMARFAAEQLAAIARAQLLRMLSKATGGEGAGDAAGAAETAAAAATLAAAGAAVNASGAAVTAGATTLTAAGGTVLAGATAVMTAAAQLQVAANTMLVANAASAAGGFASGGYTGPGGKYQPAGTVHAGEFVHRREVVRQPGALPFLRDFNRIGMAAINRYQAGYADGGLVTPVPRMPAPRFQMPDSAIPPSLPPELHLQLINAFDIDEAIERHFASRRGDKTLLNSVNRNSTGIKTMVVK